jgi:hypothetical protein
MLCPNARRQPLVAHTGAQPHACGSAHRQTSRSPKPFAAYGPGFPMILKRNIGITVHPKQPVSAARHRATQTKPIWFLLVRRHADAPPPASPDDSTTFNDFPRLGTRLQGPGWLKFVVPYPRRSQGLAQRLERDWSGVASSILEGIDKILTVGTNIINVMGTVRRVCRNVKRWRSAAVAMRLTAAAMPEAAKGFRRLKAHKPSVAGRSGSSSKQALTRLPCLPSHRRLTSVLAATASQCSTKIGTSPY